MVRSRAQNDYREIDILGEAGEIKNNLIEYTYQQQDFSNEHKRYIEHGIDQLAEIFRILLQKFDQWEQNLGRHERDYRNLTRERDVLRQNNQAIFQQYNTERRRNTILKFQKTSNAITIIT